ncbi:MAG: hypothetical protein M0Z84_13290 [Gammaproteobacteria bacterium]|nr:hypothetical protein [Gammaproteobacteria bacterium]
MHELFAAAGDIQVTDAELRITLAALSSPYRTRNAHALCHILHEAATAFPGSPADRTTAAPFRPVNATETGPLRDALWQEA